MRHDQSYETNNPVQPTTHKVGRLLLTAGIVAGAGGAAYGINSAVESSNQAHAATQVEVGKVLRPVMTKLDEQLIADHAKDPARFVLTPAGMRAVKITDTRVDTSSAGDTSFNETFGVMGADEDGQPVADKPLYFSNEGGSKDSATGTTGSMLKIMAPGGEQWGHEDDYDAAGWQVKTSAGADGPAFTGGGYYDTADPPAPLDAPVDDSGNRVDGPVGLANLAVQQMRETPPKL